jgi:hypothetical protein
MLGRPKIRNWKPMLGKFGSDLHPTRGKQTKQAGGLCTLHKPGTLTAVIGVIGYGS